MRIYVIGNDGITLCREAPARVIEGEIAVTSKEELQAARSAANGCWRCGMHCPVSKRGKGRGSRGTDRRAVVGDRGAARAGTAIRREATVKAG